MTKITNKFSFGKLFYNDKFVMFFSIFVAFILWIIVSTGSQETTTFTVKNIPVDLTGLSNDLQVFSDKDLTAEVKISGNPLIIANVTSSDIVISPKDINEITQPGDYTLDLVPKKNSVKSDYTFDSSVTPSNINVYVDRYAERKITITDKISVATEDSYSALSTTLSQQTVTVTGAEKVVNNISKVCAEYTNTSKLTDTTVVTASLVFYNANNEKIDTTYITPDIKSVDATIPVYKIKTVSVQPNYINKLDTTILDSSIVTISPSEVKLAMQNGATDIDSISTEEIDLSKVNLTNNQFTVNLIVPSGYRNMADSDSVTVKFDTSDMISKTFKTSKITVVNQRGDRTTTVNNQNIEVTIIGPKDEVNKLNSSNITGIIDMSSKTEFEGTTEMPVTININSKFSGCWAYGTYTSFVTVSGQESTVSTADSSLTA